MQTYTNERTLRELYERELELYKSGRMRRQPKMVVEQLRAGQILGAESILTSDPNDPRWGCDVIAAEPAVAIGFTPASLERAYQSNMKRRLTALGRIPRERTSQEVDELCDWLRSLHVPRHLFRGLSKPCLEAMAHRLTLPPAIREGSTMAQLGTPIEGLSILLQGECRMFRPDTLEEIESRLESEAEARSLCEQGRAAVLQGEYEVASSLFLEAGRLDPRERNIVVLYKDAAEKFKAKQEEEANALSPTRRRRRRKAPPAGIEAALSLEKEWMDGVSPSREGETLELCPSGSVFGWEGLAEEGLIYVL